MNLNYISAKLCAAALLIILALSGCMTPKTQIDSAYLQKLIDSIPKETGGEIQLDSGIYTVNATIKIPTGVSICGMGNDTILKASESFNGSFFQNANPKGNSGIRLATMKLKTLNTASKAPAIFFKNVKGASLQNISITGFSGIGILLENCDSIKAVNSRLEGEKNAKAKAVIRLNSSVDCIIAENKIKGNGKCGIALCEGSNNNVLDENVISKTEYGIQINSSYFNLLKDNNIEQTKIGVSLKSSTNSTLLGNTIKQSSNIAILLEDDKKSKLLRNSLSMITGKSAIKLIRSNGTVLQNNLISKNTGSGISAVKSKDMKLLFNIFDKNKKDLFDIDAKSKLKLESLNGVNKAGRK